MSDAASFRLGRTKRGTALIIVLFFVVLLTGLTIAFLSRSMTARQVSSSSVSGTEASVLADSACEIILGDLKQEIIDGSTVTVPAAGYTLYTPKATAGANAGSTAIPAAVGFTPAIVNGVETDGLANLEKISLRNQPFYGGTSNSNYANTGISRASAVNSANDPALNGRVISPARWNSHYLLGRKSTGSTLDSTPVAGFPAPDWVIVTRSGAGTAYTSDAQVNLLKNPTGANSATYAIGRFAYVVYNEGGLLDMNAAGYPLNDSSGGSVGLTAQQSSQKAASALADLSQLINYVPSLTQGQINNIIGWRNPYTSQLSANNSAFGAVKFDATSSKNWLNNFALYNVGQVNPNLNNNAPMAGFTQVNTNAASSFYPNPGTSNSNTAAPTDQILLSRQQLISLIKSLNISPDVLQYLGTFSRSLEQPSYSPDPYSPDPHRPLVLSPASPPPTAGVARPNEGNYMGNNDAAGGDAVINPAFLSVRVTTPFTRFNGATAAGGEPLIKYRFPLSRLAMVAYNATNTSLPLGFAKTSSDPDPIYDHFGLKRTSTSSAWVYNHGITNSAGKIIIGTLSQVAAAGREPDFAELLKAAITVGALAKGGPNFQVNNLVSPDTTGDNYEYTLDTAVDYQVLQIMANLIDQQDADSYPTWLQIATGPGGTTNIYGVEDLPYLYRETPMPVVETAPTTPINTGPVNLATPANFTATPTGGTRMVQTYKWAASTGTQSASPYSRPVSTTFPATLENAVKSNAAPSGTVGYMYVVQVWNPHDPNTATANTISHRPAKFRLIALTQNPATGPTGSPTGTPWKIGVESTMFDGSIFPDKDATPASNYYWPISTPIQLTASNTALDFTDGNGTYFREPTMLWNKNSVPSLSPESAGTSQLTDANTGKVYYGVVIGAVPMQMTVTISTSGATGPPDDGTYLMQTVGLTPTATLPTNVFGQITFCLQYQDTNNNWITYDSSYTWPNHSNQTVPPIRLKSDGADTTSEWKNPMLALMYPTVQFDPRTARWGVENEVNLGEISSGTQGISTGTAGYLLEPTVNTAAVQSDSTSRNTTMGNNNFSVFETERPRADKGESDTYNNPGNAWGSSYSLNAQMHLFSGGNFSYASASSNPSEFGGLMSQNNPALTFNGRDNATSNHYYFEDADGVSRRAMAAYADTTMTDSSTSSLAQPITTTPHRIGLPLATANTYASNNALGTPTQQSQSRPIILNRPFHGVSEMSYSFTGTPWRNIDFFTPESGYAGLLDVFCVGDPPTSGLTAGKVDLNTRQAPVIQALVAGTSRDEWYNASNPPAYALPPLTGIEAKNVATSLVQYTNDLTDYWRGPLTNISNLVGRFIYPSVASTQTTNISINNNLDWYTYNLTAPASGQATYAGFTGLLDSKVYNDASVANNANAVSPIIERFRESALRPLADNGQTRVWNLLIDVVAQTGRYPSTATSLKQFEVDGERRIWLHVAIDRYTGEILDKQVEVAAQ